MRALGASAIASREERPSRRDRGAIAFFFLVHCHLQRGIETTDCDPLIADGALVSGRFPGRRMVRWMEPGSDDHVLDVLRGFAGGALSSIGTRITVLCGAARIEGAISNSSAYSEHLGEELSAAFRETAAAARDEQAREAAEHLAEVFAEDRYVATNERRRTRRREIAERLRELDAFEDSAEVADLQHEEEHLGELTPILVLRNARVWAPGHDALHGPSDVPFVRIRVAAISAWWLGTDSG
jgi:hypothetical protein